MSADFNAQVGNPSPPTPNSHAPRYHSSNNRKLSDLSLKPTVTHHFHLSARAAQASRQLPETLRGILYHTCLVCMCSTCEKPTLKKNVTKVPLTHPMLLRLVADVDVGSALSASLLHTEAAHLFASHRTGCVSCLSPILASQTAICSPYSLVSLFTPVLLPPAALPSGHSLELLTETGCVASPQKDKTDPYDKQQTENTFPSNSVCTSLRT